MSPSISPVARRLQKTATTPPLIGPTPTGEHPRMEALQSEIQNLAAPFLEAPPAHQGTLGYVSQGLNGVLGVLDAPSTLLDTGFAMATSWIPTLAMPAAVVGLALHFGFVHAHLHPPSLIPPAPPIPLPSIGTILLAGSISVLINGIPAARAGDVGFAITCCSLAPPAEIILGSSSVFIGGARAARMLDMTRHDNPVPVGLFTKAMAMTAAGWVAGGLGAITLAMDANASGDAADTADAEAEAARDQAAQATDAAAKADAEADAAMASGEAEAAAAAASGQALGAALAAGQLAADVAAFALQALIGKDPGIGPGVGFIMLGSPNVLIGGFPCPNLMETLKGLLKAARGLKGKGKGNADQDAEGAGGAGCPSCKRS